jgi:hypothetical protein
MKTAHKKPRRKTKKLQRGSIGMFFTFAVLALLIVGGYFFVGGAPATRLTTNGKVVVIITPTPEQSKKSLQLETFGFVTITPTPVPKVTKGPQKSCGPEDDNGIQVPADCRCLDASVTCKGGVPYDDNGNPLTGRIGDPPVAVSTLCGSPLAPGDGRYCVAKPVIYLYPQEPEPVSVSVASTGQIVVSDPLYPQGGWKNVLANPNGSLFYGNKQYSELFYETDVTTFAKPHTGILIPKNTLKPALSGILDQLGLIATEKQEFLEFWLPRLQQINAPYIYFSVLDTTVKNTIDKVKISPQPDTQIAFIAYFKPVTDTRSLDTTLSLPQKPKRSGFVSVEWGGVIDYQ